MKGDTLRADKSNVGLEPDKTSVSNTSHIEILATSPKVLPIQSNLPSLLVNLRTNDGKSVSNHHESSSIVSSNPTFRSVPTAKLHEDLSRETSCVDSLHLTDATDKSVANPDITADIPFNENRIDEVALKRSQEQSGKVKVPQVLLKEGLSLYKVSHKSKKRVLLKVDPFNFSISWKSVATQSISSNTFQKLLNSKVITHTSQMGSNSFGTKSIPTTSKKAIEIFFDDIKNFVFQGNASPYREELHISKDFEAFWCTVIYFNSKKGKLKTLNLIADTDHDYKRLHMGLNSLKLYRDDIRQKFLNVSDIPRNISFLEDYAKEPKEFLTFQDIIKYTKRLNINLGQKHLQSIFDTVSDHTPHGVTELHSFYKKSPSPAEHLDFDQFRKFVTIIKKRPDIDRIWEDICGKNIPMGFDEFKYFMKDVQKERLSEEGYLRIFKKFCLEKRNSWIPESLNNYLLSKYSMHLNLSECANFDQPLNEYFISSSHNTYLIGRQVAGDSSIDGYVRALQRGCKCVEIDIWDGKDDTNFDQETKSSFVSSAFNGDDPIVNHGRTFTTSISFINVMKTIKKYAFVNSSLPLILSLEIRCSLQNQLKLVSILKDILGELLVISPINDSAEVLPSPNELRNKILLKVKKGSDLNQANDMSDFSTTSSTTTSFSEDNGSISRKNSFSLRTRSEKPKICSELSSLGVYVQGIKFRNFSLPESKTFNHCFSLSEKSINSMLKDDSKRKAIDKHNRRYLMRVYPSKFRLKSSNFSPINFWAHGVQFVATNWQTYDVGQQINQALFEGQGYILKPFELRKPTLKSSRVVTPSDKPIKTQFNIEIISAHQLPKAKSSESPINPFVLMEIIGADSIEWETSNMAKSKTQIVAENGFHPVWNERFSGTIIARNELIFIKFTIKSSTGSDETHTIGLIVAKLSHINQGYRYLPIHDLFGEQLIYSSLLVKISYSQIM